MRPTTHGPRRGLVRAGVVALASLLATPTAAPAQEPTSPAAEPLVANPSLAASPIVFPFVGPVLAWTDDYGTPRGNGPHEGNDIAAPMGTPVVAVASGRVQKVYWRGAGWTLVLTAATTDEFVYMHLGREGRAATAFAPGLKSGDYVRQGELLGFVGISGNAPDDTPHLHFEHHPLGGHHVSPYALLRAAPRLIYAAPRGEAANGLTMSLWGTVVAADATASPPALTLRVRRAALSDGTSLPFRRDLVLSVPADAVVARDGAAASVPELGPGDGVAVETAPLGLSVGEQAGVAGALVAGQVTATAGEVAAFLRIAGKPAAVRR